MPNTGTDQTYPDSHGSKTGHESSSMNSSLREVKWNFSGLMEDGEISERKPVDFFAAEGVRRETEKIVSKIDQTLKIENNGEYLIRMFEKGK